MSGICPSCGGPIEDSGDRCRHCGQGTTRRYFTGSTPKSNNPVPPDVDLPCFVPDARFVVGEVWMHGQVYLTDLGIYFLADADGPWPAERMLFIVPPDPSKPRQFAPSSHFYPLNRIERFQHSRLTSFAMLTTEGKRPMRLDHEGWKLIDGFAAKVGIPVG